MTEPAVAPVRIVQLPYHRLHRAQPEFRWWRPLVAVVLMAVFFFGVSLLVAIPAFVVLLVSGGIDLATGAGTTPEELTELLLPDMTRPLSLVLALGSIILALPFVPLALRIAGIRPAGVRVNITHSVQFRLRWRWLLACLGPASAVWIGSLLVQIGIGVAAGEPLGAFTTDPGVYLGSALIVVLLVPLQAATEEYLFRGVLLQSVGAWVRFAPVTIVVSSVAFAFSHAYDAWGIVQVGIIGVAFAWVTIRTGGLEAAIVMHTVNNVGSFLLSGTGMFGPTGYSEETGGPLAAVGQLVTMGVWVAIVEWHARRRGVERISRIGVAEPVAPVPADATATGIPRSPAG